MLYAYTKILGNTEEDFWKSTPRKIFSLLDIHCKLHNLKPDKNNYSTSRSKNGAIKETKILKVLD